MPPPSVLTLLLSTACLSFAQQTPPESSAIFRAETQEVLLSFNVVRDRYFAPDVKREDIVLLEDGKPRAFSSFEGPASGRRPPLELVLLFQTTTMPPWDSRLSKLLTRWDREATYAFTSNWGDRESRGVLEKNGADVRVSVYRYDRQFMQRLCRRATDPQVFTSAMRRLLEPIPSGEAIPLTSPPGYEPNEVCLARGRGGLDPGSLHFYVPLSWAPEAILDTLRDSAGAPDKALRVLVAFAEGMTSYCGTRVPPPTLQPQDVADRANDLGISVYPVVLDFEKYVQHPFAYGQLDKQSDLPYPANLMERYASIGELTGGGAFYPPQIDAETVDRILGVIRNQGLSRYVVAFTPRSSGQQHAHKLEIKLKSKSSGKLMGGKRAATY